MTTPSQLALQLAAYKAKISLVEKTSNQKTARSRNFDILAEAKSTLNRRDEFHTHRAHNKITQGESLLGMFKTFLSEGKKKVFDRKKHSHKLKDADFGVSKLIKRHNF